MKRSFLFLAIAIILIGVIPNFVYAENTDDDKSKSAKLADISFVISFGAVLLIMYAASKIIKHGKGNLSLLDIIRDKDWYPSLSIFQFFMWTFVVLFAFFGIYLFRVFNGVTEPPTDIPEFLLILMGISFVVPVTSGGISSIKYASAAGSPKPAKKDLPGYSTMLNESSKPTLTRFQMFSWTWISIAIYLVILSSVVSEVVNNEINSAEQCKIKNSQSSIANQNNSNIELKCVKDLILPDIDPALVVLMGISQGAYLGGKIRMKQKLEVIEIIPKKEKIDNRITISGTNFGDSVGIVLIGNVALYADKIEKWNDNMITVRIPQIAEGKTTVRIVANGIISNELELEITK